MIIQVSAIPDTGLTIQDTALAASPFRDRSWRLDALTLHIERDGADVVVTGDVRATVSLVCGRCLEAFPVQVRAAVDLRFIPRPGTADTVELGADDLDLDFYDHDQLDLGGLIEAETTLALPMKPLCREDCRGLCPACGGNRNQAPCSCDRRPPDPRMAALRELAARLSR
jgi:uncharacterized protein